MSEEMTAGESRHERLGLPRNAGIPYHYYPSKAMSADVTGPLSEQRWHEELEIKYFISGKAEIIVGARLFIAGPGDIAVINPGQLHGTRPSEGGDAVYHLLMLPPQLPIYGLGREYGDLLRGKLQIDNYIPGDAELASLMRSLFEELENERPEYELCSSGYLSLILGGLIRRHSHPAEFRTENIVKYSDRIRPALTRIGGSYSENLPLSDLAALCRMSVPHFSRIFKLVTGYTVTEYTARIRVNKATLLFGSMSVGEAAAQVGYPDPAYFSRVFRSVAGIPPTEWIRNSKNDKIIQVN